VSFDASRLSQIQTCWQDVWGAQGNQSRSSLSQARWALLERYGNAASRYLLGAMRNVDQAQEMAQEFALLFLQGACDGADPYKGRFRDYLKGILRNLVRQHYRKQNRMPLVVDPQNVEQAVDVEPSDELDRTFLACWREDLLSRSWDALARLEAETGQPYHTVLRLRAEQPDQSSEELARGVSQRLGRDVNAPACRKMLQRAREKFGQFLLDELKGSLSDPSTENLRQELIDLDLYKYCGGLVDGKADS
jgi:DNA-directed RNA polymerase specialized sigma24 family protein